jgi:hypothetical protein
MDDPPRYRTFVETPEYQAQLDFLAAKYSVELLEGSLMAALWGMATNPQAYEQVTWNIRMAKTRSRNAVHPCFQIFFEIKNENEVLLLWIEEVDSIDMLTEK